MVGQSACRRARGVNVEGLLNLYKIATLIGISLALIFGVMSRGTAGAKVKKLIIMVILSPFIFSFAAQFWQALTPAARGVAAALAVPAALVFALTRSRFGREVAANAAGNALYDGARRPGCLVILLVLMALAFVAAVA